MVTPAAMEASRILRRVSMRRYLPMALKRAALGGYGVSSRT
jgi:hypothetical protein